VEAFGAVGDGRTDDSAAIQRALDAAVPGVTLAFQAGHTYAHSTVLYARRAGTHVSGAATLLATDESQSAFMVRANNVLVDGGLVFGIARTTRRWTTPLQSALVLDGGSGDSIIGIHVTGSAAAGIQVGNRTTNFLVQDVTVADTRSDGIHMTGGSSFGRVIRPQVQRSGDDGVSVVSYLGDGAVSHDITISSPRVYNNVWGRGLSVVGGTRITYDDIYSMASDAAGLYIASESSYNTYPVQDITVDGGSLVDANKDRSVGHGAVLVFSDQRGAVNSNITIRGLNISGTRSDAPGQIGILNGSSCINDVRINDVNITGGPATVFWRDADSAGYSLTQIDRNGTALRDVSAPPNCGGGQ
jgi:hypothetical protein